MTLHQHGSLLLQVIAQHEPNLVALRGSEQTLTYAELNNAINMQVNSWSARYSALPPTLALAVENHPAWIILDLAAMRCNMPLVPLPFFFSAAQWLHAMQDAGVSVLVTDQPHLFEPLLADKISKRSEFSLAGKVLTQYELHGIKPVSLPANTAKITYTSGTTGNPKGVCLSKDNMLNVAKSIAYATQLKTDDMHLSVLPLATLLENVAGVYATLLTGASCILLPNAQIGLSGATGLNIQQLLSTLDSTQANTAIFTPELLHALVLYLEAGTAIPQALRFLAVGGASVSPALLERAQKLGLPVYEGYGLSECASVVALNKMGNNKPGTVGKPLPHIHVGFTDDHEIVIHGNAFLGYVGQTHLQQDSVHTGDIGHFDDEGYLVISGRKKNIFITSFGRNVSPEWVERELKISPFIAQAALFGEAKPWNVAIIAPRAGASDAMIEAAVQSLNTKLPDYARIGRWIRAESAFNTQNQQLTANGRNRREVILQHYQDKINALYEEKSV